MITLHETLKPVWPEVELVCRGPVLHEPVLQPADQALQYGGGFCMQVSPTQVAMLINRRVTGEAVVDFENGWDVLIFDDVNALDARRVQPGLSNTSAIHPRTGKMLEMVTHLPTGGFIPLGATLADGAPHPHAGTGFGVAVVHGYPKDQSLASPHIAPDMHGYMQVLQFAFDGTRFTITQCQNLPHDGIIPGHYVFNRGLGQAIADDEDLLFGLVVGNNGAQAAAHARRLQEAGRKPYAAAMAPVGEWYGSGLSRWRRGANGWQVVDYVPVPEHRPDMAFEPSLIRDTDGSILMTMRGKGANVAPGQFDCGLENTYEHFRVYRSTDNGQTWESIIHQPQMRAPTPVTIGSSADGRVFLLANPYQPLQIGADGQPIMKQKQRGQLWLWPLSDDRRSLKQPAILLDCKSVLGPPRQAGNEPLANRWYADHPIGGIFRLADAKLHTLISFRLTDAATTSGGADANPHAGVWLAELSC